MLAILFFCGILHSLLSRSTLRVFLFGVLYSWSYHSFYVPMIVLGIFYLSDFDWKSPRLRLAVWGSLGLLTGLIVNPHFPWNFWMSFRHLLIALVEANQAKLDFGMELFPWSTERFLRIHLPFFFLLVISPFLVLLAVEKPREFLKKTDFSWLWGSTLVFFGLAAQSPRALEYGVPIGIILFAFVAQYFAKSPKRSALFFAVLFLTLIPRFTQVIGTVGQKVNRTEKMAVIEETVSGIRALPEAKTEASGERPHMFNSEWDFSPYIYYASPHFQFIDILDPSFLQTRDKRLHTVRWMLRQGSVPDPWGVIQSLTQSRYIINRHPALNAQLALDLHFKQVFPKVSRASDDATHIFELLPERDPHFVLDWQGRVAGMSVKPSEADRYEPGATGEWKPVFAQHEHFEREEAGIKVPRVKSAYLDLRYGRVVKDLGMDRLEGALQKEKQIQSGKLPENAAESESTKAKSEATSSATVTCVWVRPSEEDRKRQEGKELLGLGGGRNIRIWLNGSKLFRTVAAKDSVQLADRLIELDRPLRRSDVLEVLVCSSDTSLNMGVALSFWTKTEMDQRCRERGWEPAEALSQTGGWPRLGSYRDTCMGSFIRKR